MDVNVTLHHQDDSVKRFLLQGNFGLEKESLRVLPTGFMSHTLHPFPDNKHIVRDFCENQTEINTPVATSPAEAIGMLTEYTREIQKKLASLPEPEILWPFSNPAYIRNEADIPVAQFTGGYSSKTDYREYLSDRYGRYKMVLSGIHINYSFADALLQADFALSGYEHFQEYKNNLYLSVARRAVAYGWIMTALTAASPLLDSSYVEKGRMGYTTFNGMASVRCSEMGYWNYFTPVLKYGSIQAYADSIINYVQDGLLAAPTELYYPIRLKPRGLNRLVTLHNEGVDHIELRMIDLNPLEVSGLNLKDLVFAQLLLVWLACTPSDDFSMKDQVQAVQNFKNAAHYDLKTVKIVAPTGRVCSVADACLEVIEQIKAFYQDASDEIKDVIAFEEMKCIDPETRYAWIIRKQFAYQFVEQGLYLAKQKQKELLKG